MHRVIIPRPAEKGQAAGDGCWRFAPIERQSLCRQQHCDGEAAIQIKLADLGGGFARAFQRTANGAFHGDAAGKIGTLARHTVFCLPIAVEEDALGGVDTQPVRLCHAGQDDGSALIDGILCDVPFMIGVSDHVVFAAFRRKKRCVPRDRELRIGIGRRDLCKTGPQVRHQRPVLCAAIAQPRPQRMFIGGVGLRGRAQPVGRFIGIEQLGTKAAIILRALCAARPVELLPGFQRRFHRGGGF